MAEVDMPQHIDDEILGQVMTLGKHYTLDDAVTFLNEQGIPATRRALNEDRKRGRVVSSVFGSSIVFSERDLVAWVASRYGNGNEHFAERGQAGNQNAAKRDKADAATPRRANTSK